MDTAGIAHLEFQHERRTHREPCRTVQPHLRDLGRASLFRERGWGLFGVDRVPCPSHPSNATRIGYVFVATGI